MKRFVSFVLIAVIFSSLFAPAACAAPLKDGDINISAPSAILVEKQTGQILYEKDAHTRLFPASITKIMTLLLIVEAIECGKIDLDGVVTASKRASSFGGSCVYLEEGEQMTVSEMIKCIAVVSANDCAVAMAEYISGDEDQFVRAMNGRAAELHLENTHFTNCTGLFDDTEHYTTAYDVAVISRELLRHDLIKDYTTIWMDSIRGGEFELSNTNKLVYWYDGCTGLKTGYTSSALYCLSASAERGGVEFISVVMHCESSDKRNDDAKKLLDYAFANFELCSLRSGADAPQIPVELGRSKTVRTEFSGREYALVPRGSGEAEYSLSLQGSVKAPVKAGAQLGVLTVKLGGKNVAEVPLLAAEDVARISFFGIAKLLAGSLFGL